MVAISISEDRLYHPVFLHGKGSHNRNEEYREV